MSRIIMASLVLLLAAPTAQAQTAIDCSGGCTTTTYGFSDEPVPEGGSTRTPGIVNKTQGPSRLGRTDGVSCAGEEYFTAYGQALITEQDSCAVDSSTRCQVEISTGSGSGIFNQNRADIPFGADFLGVAAGIFQTFDGNVGARELNGTCTVSGADCGIDSDCTGGGGDVCRSTCFSSPATACASDADCPSADCVTAIDWDFYGTCTGSGALCDRAGTLPCGAGENCLDGWLVSNSAAANGDIGDSCVCCQSVSGTLCSLFGWVEYPDLVCPNPTTNPLRRDAPDFIFEGGAGTNWAHERITVVGQQEGVCLGNRQRSCGTRGDVWAGSDEGKCLNGTNSCQGGDPFDPADPAVASVCDDVAFGGTAGDVCDFSENGYRVPEADLLPDTRQDPVACAENIRILFGFPNQDCKVPVDIPEGDSQPGCRLINFGVGGRFDLNCNGLDDAAEGRCHPDGGTACAIDADCPSGICIADGDLCPFLEETASFLDTNNDGRGDECQCGDVNGDGAISGPDIGGMALCANGATFCDGTISDTEGDNVVTANDIGGVVAVVNGNAQTTDLICVRDIDGSQP
jgi:hypothetical protein